MTNSGKKKDINQLDLVGEIICGIECHSYSTFGDIIVIADDRDNQVVIKAESAAKNPELYHIKGNTVDRIEYVNDLSLVILHTESKIYYRDKNNKKIEGSEQWSDHFLEPHTSLFFLK